MHIALREAGLAFELSKVDLFAHRLEGGAPLSDVNPKNYVPALETDDGAVLTEAAAILQWVAEQAPDRQLLPAAGTMEVQRAHEWLNFIATELHKGFSQRLWHKETEKATRALAVLAVAAALDEPISEAEAHRAKAAVLVDALNDEPVAEQLDAVTTLSAADLYLHRYEDAAIHARRGLAIARAAGRGELVPFLVPLLVTVLHTNGQISEAADLLGEAVDSARLSRNAEALGWNLLSQAYVAVAAGDLDLALSAAQESVEVTRALDDRLVHTYARWAFASALLESGDSRAAIDVLLTAAGGEDLPRIPLAWRAHYLELVTRSWLGHGRLAEGREAAGLAAATAQQVGLEAGTAVAGRAAAAAALAAGDAATAAELALAAAGVCDAIGARVDGARARTLGGRALAAAGKREAAVAELESAARALDSFGARRYREEAQHELRRLGRRLWPPPPRAETERRRNEDARAAESSRSRSWWWSAAPTPRSHVPSCSVRRRLRPTCETSSGSSACLRGPTRLERSKALDLDQLHGDPIGIACVEASRPLPSPPGP